MKLLQIILKIWLGLLVTVGGAQVLAGEYVTYLHSDVQGSPVVATDEQGQVVWRESYAPWGQREIKDLASANPALSSKNWYTGKEEEASLDLYYYGARWYSPEIGQFYSIDPAAVTIKSQRSFGRYHYANNNPIKYVDPNGEFAHIALGLGLWATVSFANAPGMDDKLHSDNGALQFLDAMPSWRPFNKGFRYVLGAGSGTQEKYHGNDRRNSNSQHNYDILNKDGKVRKTGVGTGLAENDVSKRAQSQLQEGDTYVIRDRHPAGKGARGRAYDREKELAKEHYKNDQPMDMHRRPR